MKTLQKQLIMSVPYVTCSSDAEDECAVHGVNALLCEANHLPPRPAVASIHLTESQSAANVSFVCSACLAECVYEWVQEDGWKPFEIRPLVPIARLGSEAMSNPTEPTAPGTNEPTPVAAPNPGTSGLPETPAGAPAETPDEPQGTPVSQPADTGVNPGFNPNPSTQPYEPGPPDEGTTSVPPTQENVPNDQDDPRKS